MLCCNVCDDVALELEEPETLESERRLLRADAYEGPLVLVEPMHRVERDPEPPVRSRRDGDAHLHARVASPFLTLVELDRRAGRVGAARSPRIAMPARRAPRYRDQLARHRRRDGVARSGAAAIAAVMRCSRSTRSRATRSRLRATSSSRS